MTMHPASRMTHKRDNPYFHYGPLCGCMTQRCKLYIKINITIQLISVSHLLAAEKEPREINVESSSLVTNNVY